jgi:hypothetical protein
MNTKLVDSLIQIINSLTKEERQILEEKLFLDLSEPSVKEIEKLAQKGGSFDFLYNEPELYTLEDGEPV